MQIPCKTITGLSSAEKPGLNTLHPAKKNTQWRPVWADAFTPAAHGVGHTHLPGNEHPLFGFLQRILVHLKHQGIAAGLIFPKVDGRTFEALFDYCDPDGTIWVLRVGSQPGEVIYTPEWFVEEDLGDPDMTYYRIKPDVIETAVEAFFEALSELKIKQIQELTRQN
jgi:hypothetical protein